MNDYLWFKKEAIDIVSFRPRVACYSIEHFIVQNVNNIQWVSLMV